MRIVTSQMCPLKQLCAPRHGGRGGKNNGPGPPQPSNRVGQQATLYPNPGTWTRTRTTRRIVRTQRSSLLVELFGGGEGGGMQVVNHQLSRLLIGVRSDHCLSLKSVPNVTIE